MECPVCLEPVTTAVTLQCGSNHTLNQACAERLYGKTNEKGELLIPDSNGCPVCRQVVIGYGPNYDIRDIIEQPKIEPKPLTPERVSPQFKESIYYAFTNSDAKDLELFLKADPNFDLDAPYKGSTLLLNAYRKSNEIFEILLKAGADPNKKVDQTPLTKALCWVDPHEKIELLLRYGADPNIPNDDGLYPIARAAADGLIKVLELLLANGADININTQTDLHWKGGTLNALQAAILFRNDHPRDKDSLKVISFLLRNGADDKTPFPDGTKPLDKLSEKSRKLLNG